MPTPQAAAAAAAPVRLSWSNRDRLRLITWTGLVGLVLAGAMAVFGLPPFDLHSPLHDAGIMDPLCGGTRAARLTTQGHLGEAWRYNPLGILTVFAAATAAARLLVGVTTRRWLNVDVLWTRRRLRVVLLVVLLLAVALEIRQQGRAGLLMQTH